LLIDMSNSLNGSLATDLLGINFFNYPSNTYDLIDAGGGFWEIVPSVSVIVAPEPSTWSTGGGLLALAAWHWRRRKVRHEWHYAMDREDARPPFLSRD